MSQHTIPSGTGAERRYLKRPVQKRPQRGQKDVPHRQSALGHRKRPDAAFAQPEIDRLNEAQSSRDIKSFWITAETIVRALRESTGTYEPGN